MKRLILFNYFVCCSKYIGGYFLFIFESFGAYSFQRFSFLLFPVLKELPDKVNFLYVSKFSFGEKASDLINPHLLH
jgi:hypothetical protein